MPPLVGDISRYNLRNSDQFQTLECKSQLYYNSFLPSVVREWNSLNESCRSSPSVDCFKNKLKQSRNVPKYYYSGSRKGQILHTRLRTNTRGRKENPQKLTQLSSRSHPRHLVGKRTAQKDTIIDITSDSQVNSNFPNRWSPASLTFNNYFLLFYIYI